MSALLDRRWLLAMGLGASLAACGGPMKLVVHGSEIAPGVDAVVEAAPDAASLLTRVRLEVTHLPPPGRIAEGAVAFVVWAQGDRLAPWARVGALAYDAGDRSGRLDATVPWTSFELQVTVEDDPAAAAPRGRLLFREAVSK